MIVERIIFLQTDNETTREALDLFENKGAEGALQFLAQWHYPGEHETADYLGHGNSDDVYEIGDYVLSVNTGLGYIGLEYIAKRGDK